MSDIIAEVHTPSESSKNAFRIEVWADRKEVVTPREAIGMMVNVLKKMIVDMTDLKGDPEELLIAAIKSERNTRRINNTKDKDTIQ